jgi:tape measure domain-containing protein
MAVELATAYISIVPSTSKLAPAISKDLGQVEKTAKPAGNKIGDSMLAGIGKSLKFGALAVGGVAIAGIGTALVKGFSRLKSLDQARAKLLGLGNSAKTVQKIMDNALASVKGTAFGMDEAATTSAMAVAAGIKPGKQLEGVLKTIADTATIAGSSMGEMGQIFGSVAARGKLQGDDLMQLQSRGVPVLAFLAKHYRITAQAASKMVSEGKVDFKNFEAAMKQNLGGAALKSGNTFQGTVDNMMAALGRFGANALQDIFPALKNGFGSITEWVDGLSSTMGPFFQSIGQGIGDFISGITMSRDARDEFAGQMSGLVLVGANVRAAFEEVVGGIRAMVAAFQDGGDDVTSSGFAGVLERVGIAARNVTDFMSKNPALFKSIAAGVLGIVAALMIWSAYTKVATAIQVAYNAVLLANPIGLIIVALAGLVAGLTFFFTQTELGRQVWANFTQFLGDAWNWLWGSVLKPTIDAIGTAFNWLWTSVIQPVASFVTAAVTAIGAVFIWWWQNVTMPVVNGIAAVFRFLWGIVRPIFDLWIAAIKIYAGVLIWLWKNAVVPAVQGIGAVFVWLWGNVVRPVFGWIGDKAKLIGTGFRILYQAYVKPAFDAIGSVFRWIWGSVISPTFDKIGKAVGLVGRAIGTAFRAAGDAIRAAFNGIVGFVRGIINGIIGAVNGVLRGINAVAGVIGAALGMDIHVSTIPMLANGAIVRATSGRGSLVNVGEGRYDEAVIPLGGPQFRQLADALADAMGRGASDGPSVFNLFDADGVLRGTMRGEIQSYDSAQSRRAGAGVRSLG